MIALLTTSLTCSFGFAENKDSEKTPKCSSHLGSPSEKRPALSDLERLQMRLETYHQIFPGFIPSYEVKEIYLPLLAEMQEKALQGLDFTDQEQSEYDRLQERLSGVPVRASIGGSPNKGLHPQKAREVLRFYEPWERDLLF